MYGGLSKKLVCFLFIQMGMNGFSDYHCQFVGMKVCRNARCTFFLVYHRYKSVYFLQAAIIRRFL